VVEPHESELTADLVLLRADAAMYAAKRSGKNRLVSYASGMTSTARTSDLTIQLSEALTALLSTNPAKAPLDRAPERGSNLTESGGLQLAYQPVVRLADGDVVAVEALARWHHPQAGTIAPGLLLRTAEMSGLTARLDELILSRACLDAVALRDTHPTAAAVHVNVTAARVTEASLVEQVRSALERSRLPGDALVLEITETSAISNFVAAAEVLQAIRRLGVHIALDDFGAGNTNLSYLLQLPIDILKLDRTLISGGASASRADAIGAGTAQIARRLGIPMIAEGIEELAQAAWLAGLGCEYGQGYLYGPPLPRERLDMFASRSFRSATASAE
jgi:EAL domain-containing protein (putative c-di-GMP-specific phosphodiesterase class I)